MALTRADLLRLFELLNGELKAKDVAGELYLVGGAVMCLVFEARQSTNDVDGYFKPVRTMRDASAAVAVANDLPDDWLNDAVQRFMSPQGEFQPYTTRSHLKILTATPEYLLSMKCLAMRLGAGFQDESDLRFLLRYLNISRYDTALKMIGHYYPIDRFPQKTLHALQEILGARS